MIKVRATSFATPKDLRQYIKCRDNGGSERECLASGDNGEGAWGDETWVFNKAYVALHGVAHNTRVRFRLFGVGNGDFVEAVVKDKGPEGVIDLNPGALVKCGLQGTEDISCEAEYEILS